MAGHDYSTRRKQKGLLPFTYNILVLRQRRLTNGLKQAKNFLSLLNLIPAELKNHTADQVNKVEKHKLGPRNRLQGTIRTHFVVPQNLKN